MENKECNCSECEHWDECEIGLIVHNPITGITKHPAPDCKNIEAFTCMNDSNTYYFKISKGDKVAQCTLKEHKGYLLGYESDAVRIGGFGSTGK